MKVHIGYKIGNGKKISVWHERWHQCGPLNQYITQREIYNVRLLSSNSIAEVTENGVWKWPNEWFSKYPILNNIKAPCLDINLEDMIVWVTNSGS